MTTSVTAAALSQSASDSKPKVNAENVRIS
jgi:hypothetical protein